MKSRDIMRAYAAFVVLLLTVIIPGSKYKAAERLLDEGRHVEAALAFWEIASYSDARERSLELWNSIAVRDTVSAGIFHTVGLKADGTAVAVGENKHGKCDVSSWSDSKLPKQR